MQNERLLMLTSSHKNTSVHNTAVLLNSLNNISRYRENIMAAQGKQNAVSKKAAGSCSEGRDRRAVARRVCAAQAAASSRTLATVPVTGKDKTAAGVELKELTMTLLREAKMQGTTLTFDDMWKAHKERILRAYKRGGDHYRRLVFPTCQRIVNAKLESGKHLS
jgi:hypothetical protein